MAKKEWLEGYSAYFNMVNMSDEDRQKANDFLARLGEMADGCATEGEFNERFVASSLAQEYGALVAKISNAGTDGPLNMPSTADVMKQQMKQMPGHLAKGYAETQVRGTVSSTINRMLPNEVQQVRRFTLSSLPVVGPLFSWISDINFFRNLFGVRNKDKE